MNFTLYKKKLKISALMTFPDDAWTALSRITGSMTMLAFSSFSYMHSFSYKTCSSMKQQKHNFISLLNIIRL